MKRAAKPRDLHVTEGMWLYVGEDERAFLEVDIGVAALSYNEAERVSHWFYRYASWAKPKGK